MIFASADSPLVIEMTPAVVDVLQRSRQTGGATERGGQLFAMIAAQRAKIVVATGERPGDRGTRTSFVIDREAAQKEIDFQYARGRHYIGDWHTHPENRPSMSSTDRASMAALYASSRHELLALVLVIVGLKPKPSTWWCSLHRGDEFLRFAPFMM
jgi:integrative and conjugative element protein (TIGR02256 family)